jgi:mono/diheme cytochrome c family protein
MRHAFGVALLVTLALAVPPATAQDRAARLGQAAAEQLCAECHAVRGGEARSPYASAPAFRVVAAVPGMSATALRVALATSHRSMPNIMLQPDEREDIVAYILSLK